MISLAGAANESNAAEAISAVSQLVSQAGLAAQPLGLLVSSAVIAAVVSGVVGGLFGLSTIRAQYKNEYYQIVINKRVAAYEYVEQLVALLKTAIVGSDVRPYHWVFDYPREELALQVKLAQVQNYALWI